MSLHSAIMNLTPDVHVFCEDVSVRLTYNGHIYCGCAYCHEEDKEFFSEKVGATIAHYRAMIKIYNDEIKRAEMVSQVLWAAYKDVIYNSQTNGEPTDPTGAFINRVYAANDLVSRYKAQRNTLRKQLKSYLAAQEKCIESVKRQRTNNSEDKTV